MPFVTEKEQRLPQRSMSWREQNAKIRLEVARLRLALEEIRDPIRFIRQRADEQGLAVDGLYASLLSNSANYLKEIAQKALELT